MRRRRLAAILTAAIALPLTAVALPAAPAVAAPTKQQPAQADYTMGVKDTNVVDGKRLAVPDHYTPKAKAKSSAAAAATPPVGTV